MFIGNSNSCYRQEVKALKMQSSYLSFFGLVFFGFFFNKSLGHKCTRMVSLFLFIQLLISEAFRVLFQSGSKWVCFVVCFAIFFSELQMLVLWVKAESRLLYPHNQHLHNRKKIQILLALISLQASYWFKWTIFHHFPHGYRYKQAF